MSLKVVKSIFRKNPGVLGPQHASSWSNLNVHNDRVESPPSPPWQIGLKMSLTKTVIQKEIQRSSSGDENDTDIDDQNEGIINPQKPIFKTHL